MEAATLISELKRRRVIRALVGYGVASFAVLQIIEPVMHGLHWPDEVLSYLVVALAVGFPIVVSLAWIFDVSQGRVERTPPSVDLNGVRLGAALVVIGMVVSFEQCRNAMYAVAAAIFMIVLMTLRYGATQARRQALDAGVRWGVLATNPAKRAGRNPAPKRAEIEPFTSDELLWLAAELGHEKRRNYAVPVSDLAGTATG